MSEDQVYYDDPTILDAADLLRRLHPTQVVPDHNRRCMRPSTGAFDDLSMSVALADVLRAAGQGPETVLIGHPEHKLVSITAGLARSVSQVVARDPLPEDLAHAVVWGVKRKQVRKRLAHGARWVIPTSPPMYAPSPSIGPR